MDAVVFGTCLYVGAAAFIEEFSCGMTRFIGMTRMLQEKLLLKSADKSLKIAKIHFL